LNALRIGFRTRALGVTGVFLALAACTGGGADIPGEPPPSPEPGAAIDWADRPTETVALNGGFGVIACPGDAPFLCVQREGNTVGQIEYSSYPALESVGARGLQGRIEDDYSQFTSDRTGCTEGFEVETVEPEETQVAGRDGMRSEYSVVNPQGETVERYVKYWLLQDDRVHLLVAEAHEEASCSPGEGVNFTDDGLTNFEESFQRVAALSRFPAGG